MIPGRFACALMVLLAGCGSRWIDYAATGPRRPAPPRPPEAIQVYSTTRPACPYAEIGLLESNQSGLSWWGSATAIIDAMKVSASRAGGDAIMLLDHSDTHHGSHGYTGVVIQYQGPCAGSS